MIALPQVLDFPKENNIREICNSLLTLLQKKDTALYMHSQQVANYSACIAAKLGLPPAEIASIKSAALLHDIGRESGGEHASKSAALAEKILPQCGFDEKECARICEAIAEHGHDKEGNSALAELLCRADRLSRPCFACTAAGDCYWTEKNAEIVI